MLAAHVTGLRHFHVLVIKRKREIFGSHERVRSLGRKGVTEKVQGASSATPQNVPQSIKRLTKIIFVSGLLYLILMQIL